MIIAGMIFGIMGTIVGLVLICLGLFEDNVPTPIAVFGLLLAAVAIFTFITANTHDKSYNQNDIKVEYGILKEIGTTIEVDKQAILTEDVDVTKFSIGDNVVATYIEGDMDYYLVKLEKLDISK